VRTGQAEIETLTQAAADDAVRRLEGWQRRLDAWTDASHDRQQTALIKQRRVGIEAERVLAAGLAPDRALVRPLIMVVPADHPTEGVHRGPE
jgi:hypothetical protein